MRRSTINEARAEYREQRLKQNSRLRALLNRWIEGEPDLSLYIDVVVHESGGVRIATKDGTFVWWVSEWTPPSKYLPQWFPGRWRIEKREENTASGAGVIINDRRIMTLVELRQDIVSLLVSIG